MLSEGFFQTSSGWYETAWVLKVHRVWSFMCALRKPAYFAQCLMPQSLWVFPTCLLQCAHFWSVIGRYILQWYAGLVFGVEQRIAYLLVAALFLSIREWHKPKNPRNACGENAFKQALKCLTKDFFCVGIQFFSLPGNDLWKQYFFQL